MHWCHCIWHIYIYTYIISYATNLYMQYIFGFLVMPSIFQIFSPSFSSSSYYYYFFQNKISCLPGGPYTRPTSPLKCSAKNPLFWQVQHTSATFPVIFHYGQDKWAPHTFTSTKNVWRGLNLKWVQSNPFLLTKNEFFYLFIYFW